MCVAVLTLTAIVMGMAVTLVRVSVIIMCLLPLSALLIKHTGSHRRCGARTHFIWNGDCVVGKCALLEIKQLVPAVQTIQSVLMKHDKYTVRTNRANEAYLISSAVKDMHPISLSEVREFLSQTSMDTRPS
jgi:hypothetical protein